MLNRLLPWATSVAILGLVLLASWARSAEMPAPVRIGTLGILPATTAPAASKTPADRTKHVLLVTIDGLRPDVALRADMPHLRQLMKRGSFTFWAQTTHVANTLPSHASFLTGVPPEIHGVTWNSDIPIEKLPNWPKVPTIFEYAKASGYTTAMVSGKVKFCVFQKPGALDWSEVPTTGKTSDELVAEGAVRILKEHQPNVLFVHFPMVDATGHGLGWGSEAQLRTAEGADKSLGEVLDTLDQLKLTDKTLIIVTADHGGSGTGHGGDDPRSKHIPWIVAGPGIAADHDLSLHDSLVVHIEDSFAMAMDYLKLDIPSHAQGKVVRQALAANEAAAPK